MNKIIAAIIGFFMAMSMAFAAVDLNSANEAELDAIKGIGPVKAKAIVDERKKNGPFKSLEDVQARVKGIGPSTVAAWKKDGSATVGGAGAAPAAKADAKPDAKADKKGDAKADAKKADSKADAKADAKADKKGDEKKTAEKKSDDKKAAKKDEKKEAPKADAKADAKTDAKAEKK
jgi:competence ComEA-like helix-hairpin-helix protein